MRLSKNKMRMVANDVAQQLTGYGHNAVTRICSAKSMPIILLDQIASLPAHLLLCADETNLKVGMHAHSTQVFKDAPLLFIPCTS
jgi:prolyl-tRNA editing enzyme YbaK/EbsC (Cys-tRNA(Pro) deacylase)